MMGFCYEGVEGDLDVEFRRESVRFADDGVHAYPGEGGNVDCVELDAGTLVGLLKTFSLPEARERLLRCLDPDGGKDGIVGKVEEENTFGGKRYWQAEVVIDEEKPFYYWPYGEMPFFVLRDEKLGGRVEGWARWRSLEESKIYFVTGDEDFKNWSFAEVRVRIVPNTIRGIEEAIKNG